MEILKNFGFDPVLLGAQVVNFLIILFILRRFFYKPLFNMLKNRESSIKEGLKKAEEGRELFEKAIEEEKTILKNAQKQALAILDEARNQSRNILSESEENARKKTEKLIEEARAQIAQESKETEERIAKNISALAIQFLQKSVGSLFNDESQDELVTKAIKQLKNRPN